MEELIMALATPVGQGSISIIRVSGPGSIELINKFFTKNLLEVSANTINYGYIKNNQETIDEVLVSVFRAPNSYTKEDIIEINCHGGYGAIKKVMSLLSDNGVRYAEPGEFTKRAFLNGRITLNEAESVMDVIKAESDIALKLSLASLQGSLTKQIKAIKQQLISVVSFLEVNIDYPEYEDDKPAINVPKSLQKSLDELKKLLSLKSDSNIVMEGINIAIIGKPNVGKSSLLNAIIDKEKAIVSEYAGTTRDLIEADIYLDGIKINLIDTAGIRESADHVENIGIKKAYEQLSRADVVMYIIDSTKNITLEDRKIIDDILDKVIVIFNKIDLMTNLQRDEKFIYTSMQTLEGITNLKNAIKNKVHVNSEILSRNIYLNERQYQLLNQASKELSEVVDKYNPEITDLILLDLRNICEYLSEITGEVYYDDLIDNIFANFCLGK